MKSYTGKERREVALPSQEGKQGVMQYALYVTLRLFALYAIQPSSIQRGTYNAHAAHTALPLIKSPIGHAKDPSGP